MYIEKPIAAGKEPIAVDVKKGETYYWCTYGKSSNQPFCNGAHEGTSFTAEKDETVYLCTCKQTKNPPYCDSSHKNL